MFLFKRTTLIPGETHATHDPKSVASTDTCGLLGLYSARVLQERRDPEAKSALEKYSKASSEINAIAKQIGTLDSNRQLCEMVELFEKREKLIMASAKAVAAYVPPAAMYTSAVCTTPLDDPSSNLQIDKERKTVAEIRRTLESKLSQEELARLDSFADFLKARDDSSSIMAQELSALVKRRPEGVAVAIIGAAHTDRIVEKLRDSNIQIAVVKLESLKALESADKETLAKLRHVSGLRRALLPVNKNPLGEKLVSAFSSDKLKDWFLIRQIEACKGKQKKEETVLIAPWFKAKSQFHAALDSVAKVALGAGGPPQPPGKYPLSGLSSDDERWNKSNVHVLVQQGSLVYPENGGKPQVVVPIQITNDEGKRAGEPIWVTISSTSPSTINQDLTDGEIEKILERAIADERQNGAPPPRPRPDPERAGGEPVRISLYVESKVFQTEREALESVNAR